MKSQYLDHLQNTSPCKVAFSFSKSNRFLRLQTYTPNKFYDKKDTRSRRATSMGFGKKLDLQNKVSGDPGLYNIKGSFDFRKTANQSQFGQSHTKIYDRLINNYKVPGPGSYNPQETKNVKFYMGQKLKTMPDKQVPSPQHYSIKEPCLDKLSRYSCKKSFKIRTQGSQRLYLKKSDTKLIGPGKYNIQQVDSIESIMKRKKARPSFTKTQRLIPIRKNNSIGPGSYQAFSIFNQDINL